jgi:DNA-binding LacI/PurR family transcriptional regulator
MRLRFTSYVVTQEQIMASRPTTQADVARMASVSRATVSLVLNPSSSSRVPISEVTRQRVLLAAQELGYTPNPVAQMLAGGHNNLIGVFVYLREFPIEQQDFFHYFLLGIERGAQAANYNLVLFTSSPTPGNRHIYLNGQNTLSLAAGSILLGGEPDRAELCRLTQDGYPFVHIGRREVDGCQIDWVSNDYRAGSYQATRHLIDLGHKNIAIIGLRMQLESHADRLAGCRAAVTEAGDVNLLVLNGAERLPPADLLQVIRTQNITALICHDEASFECVTPLLRDAGVRVPEELSLVWLSPADSVHGSRLDPTRVEFDRAAVGEAAVRLLVARLKGDCTGPQQQLLPCTFVVGATTAPPTAT